MRKILRWISHITQHSEKQLVLWDKYRHRPICWGWNVQPICKSFQFHKQVFPVRKYCWPSFLFSFITQSVIFLYFGNTILHVIKIWTQLLNSIVYDYTIRTMGKYGPLYIAALYLRIQSNGFPKWCLKNVNKLFSNRRAEMLVLGFVILLCPATCIPYFMHTVKSTHS